MAKFAIYSMTVYAGPKCSSMDSRDGMMHFPLLSAPNHEIVIDFRRALSRLHGAERYQVASVHGTYQFHRRLRDPGLSNYWAFSASFASVFVRSLKY